ncbi:MAG: aldehyde dehydrogenase family protein, partial [Planctomycetota bacterium]
SGTSRRTPARVDCNTSTVSRVPVEWTANHGTIDAVQNAVAELDAARRICPFVLPQTLRDWAAECAARLGDVAHEWVALAAKAKGLSRDDPATVEDVLTGPVLVARQFRMLIGSLDTVVGDGRSMPAANPFVDATGRGCLPVFPVPGLFDPLVFIAFRGWVRLREGLDPRQVADRLGEAFVRTVEHDPKIAVVLGAGNVSSIPATDMMEKVFLQRRRVLLKLNPVNDYLGPVFQHAFAPLIEGGVLRIVTGDATIGQAAVDHELVDEVHITGSNRAFEAIVWGADPDERAENRRRGTPRLRKPITAELGNVSPWIVIPGRYDRSELKFVARNIAASITNNCGFNCAATRVIVTARDWPQRAAFVAALKEALHATPLRRAYYPGAVERFCRFAPENVPRPLGDVIPWTLIEGVRPEDDPEFFRQEAFTPLAMEVTLPGPADGESFLDAAAAFCNERLWGTLTAAVSVPGRFLPTRSYRNLATRIAARLRYGVVGINCWPGVAYVIGSLPWGGFPGGTLENPRSGIGFVHNPFMIPEAAIEQSVLVAPNVTYPKPIWFASHPNPVPVAWRLFDLYCSPGWARASRLMLEAFRWGWRWP